MTKLFNFDFSFKKLLSITLLLIAGGIFVGAAIFLYYSYNLPDPSHIGSREIIQSTKIYDRTGEVLLYEIHGEEKRTVVPYDEIPSYVKRATVAVEDDNFYKHPAFDWKGITRALISDVLLFLNLSDSSYVQGGSTITQQLVKNAFLTSEKTISRKIKELILAIKMEQRYSKDEILNLYLNQVPYGSNAYGVEAASQTFFNKNASDLTLEEAAILAALPQRPSFYSPYGSHVDALKARQEFILERMYNLGYISSEELSEAKNKQIHFEPPARGIKAPHFVMRVREIINDIYGENFIERAGLRVYTTLNWEYQQIAEEAVKNGVERNTQLYNGTNASLVAQDTKTGQILSMVGSADYFDVENDGNFNVATQGLRQPGSSFKPFGYLTAFNKGYTPETVLFDLETEFDTTEDPEKSYKPQNYDDMFHGPITMRNALAQSINVPAVKTLYLAGIPETINTAKQLGITTLVDGNRYGLTLVLGGGEVKLIDMVNAYATLAQEGIYHEQSYILRIEDSQGRVLERFKNSQEKVYNQQAVRVLNDILSDNIARQALFSRSNYFDIGGHEIAVKTGTTNDFKDAWTIGYTPSLVAGVWAGNNDNTPMNKGGVSILAATPIWHDFMSQVLPDIPREIFTKPDPPRTSKPVLSGEHIVRFRLGQEEFPQVHNILFYVDKNNPLGDRPTDPEKDPQFNNWEEPVLTWVEENTEKPELYNKPLPAEFTLVQNGDYTPLIHLNQPKTGSFIGDSFLVDAEIQASLGIKEIRIYMDNSLIHKKIFQSSTNSITSTSTPDNLDNQNLPTSYTLNSRITHQNESLQKVIKIEVIDKFNNSAEDSVIVYR